MFLVYFNVFADVCVYVCTRFEIAAQTYTCIKFTYNIYIDCTRFTHTQKFYCTFSGVHTRLPSKKILFQKSIMFAHYAVCLIFKRTMRMGLMTSCIMYIWISIRKCIYFFVQYREKHLIGIEI